MDANRKTVSFFVALLCIFSQPGLALEQTNPRDDNKSAVATRPLSATHGFLISPGSRYDRIQWPRAGRGVVRAHPMRLPSFQILPTWANGKSSPVKKATSSAKSVSATPAAAPTRRAVKELSWQSTLPGLLKIIGAAGGILLALFAMWRLYGNLRAPRPPARPHSSAPPTPREGSDADLSATVDDVRSPMVARDEVDQEPISTANSHEFSSEPPVELPPKAHDKPPRLRAEDDNELDVVSIDRPEDIGALSAHEPTKAPSAISPSDSPLKLQEAVAESTPVSVSPSRDKPDAEGAKHRPNIEEIIANLAVTAPVDVNVTDRRETVEALSAHENIDSPAAVFEMDGAPESDISIHAKPDTPGVAPLTARAEDLLAEFDHTAEAHSQPAAERIRPPDVDTLPHDQTRPQEPVSTAEAQQARTTPPKSADHAPTWTRPDAPTPGAPTDVDLSAIVDEDHTPVSSNDEVDHEPVSAASGICAVRVTGGNLRNNHLYLPLDFFPAEAIGGANASSTAPRKVTVTFRPGATIETDIDGVKRILRNRSAVGDFLKIGAFAEGDVVRISRKGPYSFEFTKGVPEALPADVNHDDQSDLENAAETEPAIGSVAPKAVEVDSTAPAAPLAHELAEAPSTVLEADNAREQNAVADSMPEILASEPEELATEDAPHLPNIEEIAPPGAAAAEIVSINIREAAETPSAHESLETPPTVFEDDVTPDPDTASFGEVVAGGVGPLPKIGAVGGSTDASGALPTPQVQTSGLLDVEPLADTQAPAPKAVAASEALSAHATVPKAVEHAPGAPAPTAAAWNRLGQEWQDKLFGDILLRAGIDAPDGRPLYAYAVAPNDVEALEKFLFRRMRSAEALQSTGAAFVFWAAEHIRANYPRPSERHLTWSFLFDAFRLPEDQAFARRLVKQGFDWWRRDVRQAENRNNLYLYSLLVEGGLPDALLVEEGLYRQVILGLVKDIEKEGGIRAASAVVAQIAERRLTKLPQTFQSDEFVRLFAEFGQALAQLRAALPADLPPETIESWLATHRPNWAEALPLRASAETIHRLIVPVLQIERSAVEMGGPLITRELRRDLSGHWHGYVRFGTEFWIPSALLPAGQDLRLRLIPGGALVKSEGAPALFAAPERNGWRTRLFGKTRTAVARLDLSAPVVFAAFADARPKGEIELDSGLPDPADAVSLWRPAEASDDASAVVLTLSPSGRTRAPSLWALAPSNIRPIADNDLRVEGPEPASDGAALWRVSGKGVLTFGDMRLSIETTAEAEGAEAQLVAFGDTLAGWRIARCGGLVFLGYPRLFGQKDTQDLAALADRSLVLKNSRGQTFAQHVAEWVENGATLCRLRYVSLPPTTVISAREMASGEARLTIGGLNAGCLRATARAGDVRGQAALSGGACEIVLKTAGATPGEINLQLSDPTTGAALELVAPWPARLGMLLDANGARLNRHRPMAVESLSELRAIVPPGMPGDLHIALQGAPEMILPLAGETPLGAHLAMIRALLAQATPDAQVNVWLEVAGLRQGPRLEVRRYADNAIVQTGVLRVGLDRNAPPPPENVFTEALSVQHAVHLHAVDLRGGEALCLDTTAPCDLRTILGEEGGPWLIQARLDGRPQRAVFFSTKPSCKTTRDDRIASFSLKWRALVQEPQNPEWTRVWKVIQALAEGGDAGCADQVQALADVPEALVMLTLRVRQNALVAALGLDLAAPIFWPTLPVAAFVTAVRHDYARRRDAHLQISDAVEAEDSAASSILTRIGDILALRPELAAHFGRALAENNLIHRAYDKTAPSELRENFAPKSLTDLAQAAARRFDYLPKGLRGLMPLKRPRGLAFHDDTQAVIDAPIVTAEIAAGLRPARSIETLQLIGLRLVDPEYFDAAAPAALTLALESLECAAPV